MIGEQRSVRAFLEAGGARAGKEIEVEVRPSLPTTDPRSGWPLTVPPLVILWVGERPLAVRLRSVVAISRFPTNPPPGHLIEGESQRDGLRDRADAGSRPLAVVLAAAAPTPRRALVPSDPHVQVVVVVRERDDDSRRPGEPRVRPDEDGVRPPPRGNGRRAPAIGGGRSGRRRAGRARGRRRVGSRRRRRGRSGDWRVRCSRSRGPKSPPCRRLRSPTAIRGARGERPGTRGPRRRRSASAGRCPAPPGPVGRARLTGSQVKKASPAAGIRTAACSRPAADVVREPVVPGERGGAGLSGSLALPWPNDGNECSDHLGA